MDKDKNRIKNNKGVAIILVIFIVALASIMVVNLTYSTFLSTRATGMVERQLQAEYILKSLLNFSVSLLHNDQTPNYDSFQDDVWGMFALNPRIPNEYLGLRDLNSEVYLEIIPRNSRFNISTLSNLRSNSIRSNKEPLMEAMEALMTNVGFDELLLEEETDPKFKGRRFIAEDIVPNIIDWQDRDNESFDDPFYRGLEKNYDKEEVFNNTFNFTSQLGMVPGMTPRRLNAISPFVFASATQSGFVSSINVNTASKMVLRSLTLDFPEELVEEIQTTVMTNGPFQNITDIQNLSYMTTDIFNRIRGLVSVQSSDFIVYGKVKYGLQRPYYAKAVVGKSQERNKLPEIKSASFY